jgi:hypothetical protein
MVGATRSSSPVKSPKSMLTQNPVNTPNALECADRKESDSCESAMTGQIGFKYRSGWFPRASPESVARGG